ncbi:MAG: hypothetical protein HUU16_05105 [Candidatus Omnitrophica bacterium]|nr:hypothetical protein [bacterium]NUN95530.1 hypothetical protein [Candidatus Omnitrophota bacterium]
MGPAQVSRSGPPTSHPSSPRPALLLGIVSLLLCAPTARAEDAVIQVANGAASAGQSVQIPLILSSLAGFAGGDFILSFDPRVLLIQDVDRAEATEDFLVAHGSPESGLFSISMAAAEGLSGVGAAPIALLTVQAGVDAPEGTISPIVFREARWYDESSVRHELLGDNGLLRVGGTPPSERPLTLSLSSATASPGHEATIPFSVSMPEAIGNISGGLVFDPTQIQIVGFEPAVDLLAWQIDLFPLNGLVHFDIRGPVELGGVDPLLLGNWRVAVSESATPGTASPITLTGVRIENLEGFGFASAGVGGEITVAVGPETATPTGTVSATPTSEPTASATPYPTPTPTGFDPTPTGSPTPFVPADFDCSGQVDEKDLIRFLEIWKQEAAR